jgi:NADPH:quinone reductase-like Zn-dependent oxidoreductase
MTIRAVQIDRHGGIDVLQLRRVPPPAVRDGEVLVRTIASSLNPVDWKTRAWDRGPAFPMTLGWDLAGVVVQSTVAAFRPGDRVVGISAQLATGRGTWADLVALPAGLLAPAPTAAALTEAATLPLAGLTALQALNAIADVDGARVLVAGAAGATGAFFLQLAVKAGAHVDGLVSRPAHVQPALELGAKMATADAGELPPAAYDVVFDTAGMKVDVTCLLAPAGRYVSITDEPLPVLPGFPEPYKVRVREDGPGLAHLARLVDRAELQLRVGAVYPVHRVADAHRRFEAGGLLGKVVLVF